MLERSSQLIDSFEDFESSRQVIVYNPLKDAKQFKDHKKKAKRVRLEGSTTTGGKAEVRMGLQSWREGIRVLWFFDCWFFVLFSVWFWGYYSSRLHVEVSSMHMYTHTCMHASCVAMDGVTFSFVIVVISICRSRRKRRPAEVDDSDENTTPLSKLGRFFQPKSKTEGEFTVPLDWLPTKYPQTFLWPSGRIWNVGPIYGGFFLVSTVFSVLWLHHHYASWK